MALATKKDHLIVSFIGIAFGLLAIPVLENINPAFWQLSIFNAVGLAAGFCFFANLALGIGGLLGKKFFAVWQFVKFTAVGSMNAALDMGIINLLSFIFKVYAGPLIILFNVISVSVATVNSYLLNKFWSFKSVRPITISEFIKFMTVSLGGIVINTSIVYLLTTVFGAPEAFSEPVWENISKLIAVPVTLLFNFFGYKFVVFK